jgi:myo-inositol-1(or 4)-monophosphatase
MTNVLRSPYIFDGMNYQSTLQQSLRVAEQAANFIRSQSGKVSEQDIEVKSRNSLVSYVDKQAEEILVKGLHSILPEAGFITEEGTIQQQHNDYTWIIDPLDGTTNFLQHIPFYSVSVGLWHKGEIVIGIVIDVEHRESFYAWKDGGAWCNGQPILVSGRSSVAEAVVATGFPYAAKNVSPQLLNVFDYFLKNARGIRRLGSAALDLAYVACGRFDVYYESALNAWDIAGGILLVREAGGKLTGFKTGENILETGRVVAANALIFDETSRVIQKIFTT